MEKIPSWQKNLSGYALVVEDDNLIMDDYNTKSLFIFDVAKSVETFYDSMQTIDPDDLSSPWELFEADEYCIFSSIYGGGVSMISFRQAGGVLHGGEYAGESTGFCYGGLEIKRIGRSPRYRGMSWPLRYIALAKANEMGTGIFPDRESLSKDAADQYRKSFGRFEKLPFDDKYNPKTKPLEDDCVLYSPHYPYMEMVDYLYSFDAAMPKYYDEMRANFNKFCNLISVYPPANEADGLWKMMPKEQWNEKSIRGFIQKEAEYIAELIFDENFEV